jgi:hypothetical protein
MKRDNAKRERALKAKQHAEEMSALYGNEIRFSLEMSKIYSPWSIFAHAGNRTVAQPEVIFENTDSVSSVFKHAGPDTGTVAVLNFASYRNPGGKYLEGSSAQEESLCHESFLYNVISKCDSFYDWNNSNVNRGLYLNRAIYSPGILFARDGRETMCDVITCACPNKIPAVRYHSFTAEENSEALRQRITVHYAYKGLSPDEIPAYIRHKIRLAGGSYTMIGEDALSALTGYCHGNSRVIDNVMSDALVLGAELGRSCIDSEVILAAVNEQALG